MQNVAGPTEFQRAKEFLQRVHIVDDAYCDVVMNLKESFHISALHKIIFATGVYHKVPTFSSHKHFANAAYHQGVILSSIFHENRSHGERFKVQSELEE
ncbi:hypothetical protein L596_006114 [Steinernema carpocapsae]|uniref:DUF1308 domain-containing protein n=1 Tax=Steinernema carpocapsae TaxID=34508 RepID=A0A4U8V181_STECR|nr:hypothetical protein L596_006114 [Steinernema carpocapsae]